MVGIASLLYVYEFFLRVTPGVLIHEIYHDFNIEAGTFGVISAFFYLGYTPMQVVAGIMTDHYGPKRLLVIACICCFFAILGFSLTSSIILAALSRLIIGMSSSFAYIGPLVIAKNWLPSAYFSMAAGSIQMLGCLGAIIGGTPVRYLADQLGWRTMSLWSAIIGIFLAIILYLLLRETPDSNHTTTSETSFSMRQEFQRLLEVCQHPQTLWISIIGFCFWAPMAIFAENLGPSYLTTLTGKSQYLAHNMLVSTWIGVAIGGPIIGWLSGYIKNRKIPIMLSLSLSMIASSYLLSAGSSINEYLLQCLLFIFGFGASAQCVTFGLVGDHQPKHLLGTAVGLNNLAVIAGGTTLLPFCSWIIETIGNSHWHQDMLIYPLYNYQIALSLMPTVSLVGIIICHFKIIETNAKTAHTHH